MTEHESEQVGSRQRRPRRRHHPPRSPESGRPFTTADLDNSGLSEWMLRRQYRRLFRGVYIQREAEVTTEILADAALLTSSAGAYISHHTAALLWGGVVPDNPDVHVTYPGARPECSGISAHRCKRSQMVVTRSGLRTTAPMQTFLDLAQVLCLVDLVVLGDSLVRKQRFSPDDLVTFVSARAAGPFSRLAKRAASLVRSGVDSPMETRTRLLIVLAGLAEPTVNHVVLDAEGNVLRRFDLAYVEARLAIEYDGRQHAESEQQWHTDIGRDEQLDDWEVRRLVIVAKDIYSTPARTLARITKAMRARGMAVPQLSQEWRRHFPSRPGDVVLPA